MKKKTYRFKNKPHLWFGWVDIHSFPISKPNASYRLKVNSYLGDRRVFLPIPNEYPVSWIVSAPLSFEGLLKTHWVSLTHCSPTGILTPIIPLEGVCPIQLNDRAKLWWRQWESNPPHGDCKSSSPSLGTFAPIFFYWAGGGNRTLVLRLEV